MTVAALLEVMKPRHAALSASSLPCASPCCSFFLSPSSSSVGGGGSSSNGRRSLPPSGPASSAQLRDRTTQHNTQHANRERLTNSAPVKVAHSLAAMLTHVFLTARASFRMSLNYLYSRTPLTFCLCLASLFTKSVNYFICLFSFSKKVCAVV